MGAPRHSDNAIHLRGVWKIFGSSVEEALAAARERGAGKTELLGTFGCVLGVADVSLEIFPGEIFCIMGLSGSGKSTLVRHLNRLIEPTAGDIIVLGRNITDLSDSELRAMRARHIGMVFQHMALMPHRSVRDNVAFPLEVRGETKTSRWKISQDALSLVNLDGFEDRMPDELSGGMQQRVGLARALASDPDILLMDEPFSALDPLIRHQLQQQFMDISSRLKKTTVFITHDLDEAVRIGDRVAIMKDGRVVQVGAPEDIILHPADDYVADFVAHMSKLKFVRAQSIMTALGDWEGAAPSADAPRVDGDITLNELIDIVVRHDSPIVVTADGQDIGVVTRDVLLRGMREEAA